MSFSPTELDLIDRAQEVEIETQPPDGPAHRATIWAIVDDGQVFIRSWRGESARWYREARANPAVALHVDGQRLTATAIPATDPDAVERTSAGFRAKYPPGKSVDDMVRPEVLDTTLRLEPT